MGIYLNDDLITSIKANDVSEAFVYYDLPHQKNKSKAIEKLLITYVDQDCVSDNKVFRCSKFRVIDLNDPLVISNSFYPPVLNSILMYVSWGAEKSTMSFEDKSEFTYQNGHVTMTNGGVLAQQKK
ncbi:hypothetical protein [Yersinia canariae]|uniref:hypothetical protein n=2 Tax=Yersinia canariae TaxID=2607663 RepID=UPI0015F2ED43|nr:hypothetical protein [Yersinia canariae]